MNDERMRLREEKKKKRKTSTAFFFFFFEITDRSSFIKDKSYGCTWLIRIPFNSTSTNGEQVEQFITLYFGYNSFICYQFNLPLYVLYFLCFIFTQPRNWKDKGWNFMLEKKKKYIKWSFRIFYFKTNFYWK